MWAKSLQSCLTLCDPMDYRPPGSSVQGILQARILEWVAIPSSGGSSWPRDQTLVFYVPCTDEPVGSLPLAPPGKPMCETAAAAAKSLQSCPILCDPIDRSPQAPPSLGFSRQEHWSGLPFPSPMHESEKWNWHRSVASNCSRPHGLQPSRLLYPWDFPGKSTGVGCHDYSL